MFDTTTRGEIAGLEQMAPGTELASALASLEYASLNPYELVSVLQAQQQQAAHYQAASYWTMNEIVRAYEDPESEDPRELEEAAEGAAAEIGAALRLTRRSAEIETGLAIDLNRRVPSVFNALLFGRIDMRRARVLVDETLPVGEAVAQDVIDEVLPVASELTTGQLRRRIAKLCVDANPDAAVARYEWSLDDRRVVLEPNPSGTANLLGLDLPPHAATSIKRKIHRAAIKLRNQGDSRTMDQLRADIFLDLLRGRSTKSQAASATDRGQVNIDTDLPTLARLAEHSGDLHGYGPVIAEIARQVAEHQQDAEWRWTLRDPDTGQPIDGGIVRRRPTAAQQRKVEAFHKTCIHPGCRMPASDCDIDHRIPWSERKLTCICDLGPMCRHHHRIRHTFGWTYELVEGPDFVFTTPLRRRYTTSGRSPP